LAKNILGSVQGFLGYCETLKMKKKNVANFLEDLIIEMLI